MAKKKKKHKKKNPIAGFFLTLGMILCIGIMAFSAYKLITTWLEYRAGDEEYTALREYTAPQPVEVVEEVVVEDEVRDEEDARSRRKPPIDVDWASLKKINEDIIGWIYIGALDISYPVVQGKDNDYYLHRTFERQDNFAGAIFLEAQNKNDFTEPNTIVYGHNMKNGSMFGRLKDLTNEEKKYKDDPYFWVLTPKANFRYRMFSLHVTGATSEVYTLFNGVDKKFLDWCGRMQESSIVKIEEENFNYHSKIVTLSTCTADSANRYVVQGIAVRD